MIKEHTSGTEPSAESTTLDADANEIGMHQHRESVHYVMWKPSGERSDVQGESFEDLLAAAKLFEQLNADDDEKTRPRAVLLTDESFNQRRSFSDCKRWHEDFKDWWTDNRVQARITCSRAILAGLRLRKEEELRESQRISQIWTKKLSDMKSEVEAKMTQIAMKESRLKELQWRHANGVYPQGPASLAWIDGPTFTVVASVVILTNMMTMVLELIHPTYQQELWQVDQFFLLFYIVELVVKALYFRSRLLCGGWHLAAWHWMDLVIVLAGIFDQWISPFVLTSSTGPSHVSFLRALRLARLARFCKIVHIFWKSEMSWAEGVRFQSFIMGVIAFNAVLMGVEVETPHWTFVWFYVEQLLLIIFTFELIVRFKRYGLSFFTNADWVWNWLDFTIVVGGVVDQWMFPASNFILALMGYESGIGSDSVGQIMNLLRMARLLRILRLVRLIKSIPRLYNLVYGIAQAMQGMGWVLVLTSMVVYMCALVGVKMLGPRGIIWEIDEDSAAVEAAKLNPEVADAFPDIFGAVFNLFKLMNADMSSMAALMQIFPAFKFIVMVYVIFTNWAIFSILTAVVSDHMARVTEETDTKSKESLEKSAKGKLVDNIFKQLDRSEIGSISCQALKELIDNGRECENLFKMDVDNPEEVELVNFFGRWQQADMHDFFQILGIDFENGTETSITRDEFMDRLEKEGNTINQRSIMRIEKRVEKIERDLRHNMRRLLKSIEKGATKQNMFGASSNPPHKLSENEGLPIRRKASIA